MPEGLAGVDLGKSPRGGKSILEDISWGGGGGMHIVSSIQF